MAPYPYRLQRQNFKPPPPGVRITNDEVQKLDSDGNRVLGAKSAYDYDYLVVATGSEPNDFSIPGVAKHSLFFKAPEHLDVLKSHLGQSADVSVMGAGPTGLELAFKLTALGLEEVFLMRVLLLVAS